MLDKAIDALTDRVRKTLYEVEPRFPFTADPETGQWETTAAGNWCAGHWIGLLWSAASMSKDSGYLSRAAHAYTDRAGWQELRGSLFAGMNYRYAGFRAAELADDDLHSLGIRGANHVLTCFDWKTGVVPVGSFGTRGLEAEVTTDGHSVAAVDAVYTSVGLLWRAAALTGDTRYQSVARRHTDTHIRWFVRDDGSVWHKTSFDPETGTPTDRFNQLTRVPDACWSRGLGWSIAGLVDAYNATRDERYLAILASHTDYYRHWSPDDNVPYAELGPNSPADYRDTSAAALVAYGLCRLTDDDPQAVALREFGHDIRSSLVTDYLVVDGPQRGQLREGCYNPVDGIAMKHELVWSTYYLLSSLLAERSHLSLPNRK